MTSWRKVEIALKAIDEKYRGKDIIILIPEQLYTEEWNVPQGSYLHPNYDFELNINDVRVKGHDGKWQIYPIVLDDDAAVNRAEAIRAVEVKDIYYLKDLQGSNQATIFDFM